MFVRFLVLKAVVCLIALCCTSVEAGSCAGYSRSSYSYSVPVYNAPRTTYQSYRSHSYAPTYEYKDEIVYNKFLAVIPLVAYPTYSAVYAPPVVPYQQVAPNPLNQDPAKQQQLSGELQQILKSLQDVTKRFDDFDARLRRLEQGQSWVPPAAQQKAPAPKKEEKEEKNGNSNESSISFKTVNEKACAMCHQQGNESHGGDFILTSSSGKLVKLTDAQIGKMQKVLLRGTMPKLNARAKAHGITTQLTREEAQAILAAVDRQVAGLNGTE